MISSLDFFPLLILVVDPYGELWIVKFRAIGRTTEDEFAKKFRLSFSMKGNLNKFESFGNEATYIFLMNACSWLRFSRLTTDLTIICDFSSNLMNSCRHVDIVGRSSRSSGRFSVSKSWSFLRKNSLSDAIGSRLAVTFIKRWNENLLYFSLRRKSRSPPSSSSSLEFDSPSPRNCRGGFWAVQCPAASPPITAHTPEWHSPPDH